MPQPAGRGPKAPKETKTGLRDTEADSPHLLEAVTVIVYDPDTAALHPDLPAPGTGLRWDQFVSRMAEIYDARFD